MNAFAFYLPLYERLERVTPLKKDCGALCGAACCQDDGEEAGMLLFPGEEKLLVYADFGKIVESKCEYGEDKTAKLFLCDGTCDRKYHPLACRIFPLLPEKTTGKLRLRMDPRAKGMCPLARSLTPQQLEPAFLEAVKTVFCRVRKLKDGEDYLEMLQDLAADSDFLTEK